MSFFLHINLNMFFLGPVVILFALAHLFKFVRFYLVLLEERELSFSDILFLYLRTTFVNLLIPFKLGELYRVAAVKRMTGYYKTGILLVVVDRFFDTLALLCLTLPFELLFIKEADPVLSMLFAGLILLFFMYLVFHPTYSYLNRYIIMKKRSERAMTFLAVLNKANEWYLFLRKLLRGRSPLIYMASLAGWGMEFAALKLFSASIGMSFDINAFIIYISSILSGEKSRVGGIYNKMGAVILGILTLIVFIDKKSGLKRRSS